MNFNNKVILITGAGSGVGKTLAISFAKSFANLAIVDIETDNLKKTAEECKLSNVKVLQVTADITKENEVKKVVEATIEEFGGIDVLINCAGIFEYSYIQSSDILESYDRIMAINVRAVLALTNLALPALIKSKGCIVNISSVASVVIRNGTLTYSMSKVAINHLTKAVALELAPIGIRVNAILPSATKTNIFKSVGVTENGCDEAWAKFKDSSPLKRTSVILPEEIADLTLFLASDKAKSITGSMFEITAGIHLVGDKRYE